MSNSDMLLSLFLKVRAKRKHWRGVLSKGFGVLSTLASAFFFFILLGARLFTKVFASSNFVKKLIFKSIYDKLLDEVRLCSISFL